MTVELDDWEGRLAALAAGVRYRPPARRKPQRAVPARAHVTDEPPSILTEACPCDTCPLRRQCADDLLACGRYSLFLQGEPAEDWQLAPLSPTRASFDRLFCVGDPRQ
jgi:hypothetical protein